MPAALAGLLSAQMARSTPLSATARAWATWSWLLASTGSDAAIIENAMMSAERISIVSRAIGRATPRWLRMSISRRWMSIGSSLGVPETDEHLAGGPLVRGRIAGNGFLGAGHELRADQRDAPGCGGRGPGVGGAIIGREVCQVEGHDAADERRRHTVQGSVEHGAGE